MSLLRHHSNLKTWYKFLYLFVIVGHRIWLKLKWLKISRQYSVIVVYPLRLFVSLAIKSYQTISPEVLKLTQYKMHFFILPCVFYYYEIQCKFWQNFISDLWLKFLILIKNEIWIYLNKSCKLEGFWIHLLHLKSITTKPRCK